MSIVRRGEVLQDLESRQSRLSAEHELVSLIDQEARSRSQDPELLHLRDRIHVYGQVQCPRSAQFQRCQFRQAPQGLQEGEEDGLVLHLERERLQSVHVLQRHGPKADRRPFPQRELEVRDTVQLGQAWKESAFHRITLETAVELQ